MPDLSNRPDLPRWMFWDANFERLDWEEHSVAIIKRVIERGFEEHWKTLIDFYGKDRVIASLLGRCNSFPSEILAQVSDYFKISIEDLRGNSFRRLWPRHWLP